MSARSQATLWDQGGGSGEEVTEDQRGSPERLEMIVSTAGIKKVVDCSVDIRPWEL